jgi:hypothetical protein
VQHLQSQTCRPLSGARIRPMPVIPVRQLGKSGTQIFDRCGDPKQCEAKDRKVINPHRDHHAGTHG